MSEDAELQKRIAALSGLIDREKQKSHASGDSAPASSATRWAPYHVPQQRYPTRQYGRGGYKPAGFRNKTLVNKNNVPATDTSVGAGTTASEPTAQGGVTTHDRGRMQWTNASVFDKRAQEKVQAITETATAKSQAKDLAQKNQVIDHVYGQATATAQAAAPREIIINDLRFRVATDGSKLIRVFGEKSGPRRSEMTLKLADGPNAAAHDTPKETKVANVTFVRTKHGNMVRRGLLKTKRTIATKKLCPDFTSTGNVQSHSASSIPQRMQRQYYGRLRRRSYWQSLHHTNTILGSCIKGNRCRFRHDIDKLAICKEILRHGKCAAGEDCNLSHDPTPHRVPTCLHFLRNSCTKPDCRYSHVKVDPSAMVCKDFARLGYCDKGASCLERHVSECPDYTNTGTCRDRKCRLPHIDRAGTLRKAQKGTNAHAGLDDVSMDVSSDEGEFDEIDSDDADSDEDLIIGGDSGHELSQQDDFVPFS